MSEFPLDDSKNKATNVAFIDKAASLEASREALVDAATISGTLWISYLFVFFYLAIAAGGVTHHDLFLQRPVKLPFLNVDLPLLSFFAIGPLLFLVMHAYVLLHFALFASKVGDFDATLKNEIEDAQTRVRLRRQLPNNIFVQMLAGPREVQGGAIGAILRLIAQITLIIGPLALLIFFHLQFLPYHSELISWEHRITVLIDLMFLWLFWPSVASGKIVSLQLESIVQPKPAILMAASLVPISLVLTIATFPGEWLDKALPPLPFLAAEWTPHNLLVGGDASAITRRPVSLWSNRLVLTGLNIQELKSNSGDSGRGGNSALVISFRGRRLEGAILTNANLSKMDFTGARLQDAKLDDSDFREAIFGCASARILTPTVFYDDHQECAQLQGAHLRRAQLQGAKFDQAQLQGAKFYHAKAAGASFQSAQLEGAILDEAELYATNMTGAVLRGASLRGTRLELALIDQADLRGADLSSAHLNGATLSGVMLQGADVSGTHLNGTELYEARLWRITGKPFDTQALRVRWDSATARESSRCGLDCDPITVDEFRALADAFEGKYPAEPFRTSAQDRISRLDPNVAIKWSRLFWETLENSSPDSDIYKRALQDIILQVACDARQVPYVIRGLLGISFDNRFTRIEAKALVMKLLDETNCAAVSQLSEEDKIRVRTIFQDAAGAERER
jgi:uncharacterized protein YjbI with pentapeptide repeats